MRRWAIVLLVLVVVGFTLTDTASAGCRRHCGGGWYGAYYGGCCDYVAPTCCDYGWSDCGWGGCGGGYGWYGGYGRHGGGRAAWSGWNGWGGWGGGWRGSWYGAWGPRW